MPCAMSPSPSGVGARRQSPTPSGCGFGYIGSAITSPIYATYTIIFFALEGAIIVQALLVTFGLPLPLGYLLASPAILPVAAQGMTVISRFQCVTQLPRIVLALLPLVAIAWQQPQVIGEWLTAPGRKSACCRWAWPPASFCALPLQVGEQVDYLRLLPPRSSTTGPRCR